MAKKKQAPPKRKAASKAPPAPPFGRGAKAPPKRKPKIPTLGGGLAGLGGTGAQGMMP